MRKQMKNKCGAYCPPTGRIQDENNFRIISISTILKINRFSIQPEVVKCTRVCCRLAGVSLETNVHLLLPLNYIFHQSHDCCANSMSNSVDAVDSGDEWQKKKNENYAISFTFLAFDFDECAPHNVSLRNFSPTAVTHHGRANPFKIFVSGISSSVSDAHTHSHQTGHSMWHPDPIHIIIAFIFIEFFFSRLSFFFRFVFVYSVLAHPISPAKSCFVRFVSADWSNFSIKTIFFFLSIFLCRGVLLINCGNSASQTGE